jgi:hypothetical protein
MFSDNLGRRRAEQEKGIVRVQAYCLTPNHFHPVLWSRGDRELSRWMTSRESQSRKNDAFCGSRTAAAAACQQETKT